MPILQYKTFLKPLARNLRSAMTPQESLLWSFLRRKQIWGVQFFRQRAIGNYIVDFYAPSVKLVIEIDGSQHSEPEMVEQDRIRDDYLKNIELHVLRFENGQVEHCLDLVLIDINRYVEKAVQQYRKFDEQ